MSDASLSSAYRRLRIPDEERYWVEQVKCRVGCPVFTDACGYVTAVSEGLDEDAYRIARATNPFVSICGRICGAPCEKACRRGSVDAPVSIRAIKRFATEQFGTETGSDARYHRYADTRMLPRRALVWQLAHLITSRMRNMGWTAGAHCRSWAQLCKLGNI